MSKTKTRNGFEPMMQTWERISAFPLAIAAFAYLALWAFQVLAPLSSLEWEITELGIYAIWAVFILDFVLRFISHHDRKEFLKRNVIELLALALPAFRVFRVLRVITALGIFTRAAQTLQTRINIYLAVVTPLVIFSGALGVYEAERYAPHATITNFGDALWYSIVTVCTVGYGDYSPVTFQGRVIATILMFSGVVLLSSVTALVASYLLSKNNLGGTRRRK